MKELASPEWQAKYRELLRFFRDAMVKDPTDIMAVTFRIQCCMDMENYEEAEELCRLLNKEIRETMLEKIAEAKSGGD